VCLYCLCLCMPSNSWSSVCPHVYPPILLLGNSLVKELLYAFLMRSVLYERKVGDELFPESLVNSCGGVRPKSPRHASHYWAHYISIRRWSQVSMENLMEWEFGRENQSIRTKPTPVPLCLIINPTWSDLRWTQGYCGRKPVTGTFKTRPTYKITNSDKMCS
jgi:hypothetical protein